MTSPTSYEAPAVGTSSVTIKALPIDTTILNPQNYPPFDIRRVPTYTDRQLRYYHAYRALLSVDRAHLKAKMDERKADMEITGWDGVTRENTPNAASLILVLSSRFVILTQTLSLNDDSEIDSDYPKALEGQKGTKVNVSKITQLKYDSNVA